VFAASSPIFHVALPEDWPPAAGAAYDWSTRGRTRAEVGFVHCSHRDQLDGVANAFYGDRPEVVLLTIDVDRLDAPPVLEPSGPGGELFPHVYGPIPVAAVVDVVRWRRSDDGRFRLPSFGHAATQAGIAEA
jgi:uncharacterized protein (DUF952 family)